MNGERIRDLPHEEVVQLIRQQSENSEIINFSVVPKSEETLAEEN